MFVMDKDKGRKEGRMVVRMIATSLPPCHAFADENIVFISPVRLQITKWQTHTACFIVNF